MSTSDQILDCAEILIQDNGFNGFSFADISEIVGITKASIHHHFPTKAGLGARLITRYRERFGEELDGIAKKALPLRPTLQLYAKLYEDVLRAKRMCLCGILAAEIGSIPGQMRQELSTFFLLNETWLLAILSRHNGGRTSAALKQVPNCIVSGLEGAMLMARMTGDLKHFQSAKNRLIDDVCRMTIESPPGKQPDGQRRRPNPGSRSKTRR